MLYLHPRTRRQAKAWRLGVIPLFFLSAHLLADDLEKIQNLDYPKLVTHFDNSALRQRLLLAPVFLVQAGAPGDADIQEPPPKPPEKIVEVPSANKPRVKAEDREIRAARAVRNWMIGGGAAGAVVGGLLAVGILKAQAAGAIWLALGAGLGGVGIGLALGFIVGSIIALNINLG